MGKHWEDWDALSNKTNTKILCHFENNSTDENGNTLSSSSPAYESGNPITGSYSWKSGSTTAYSRWTCGTTTRSETSWEMYYYHASNPTSGQRFRLMTMGDPYWAGSYFQVYSSDGSSSLFEFCIYKNPYAAPYTVNNVGVSTISLSTNTKYHIVVTQSKTKGVRVYLNGVCVYFNIDWLYDINYGWGGCISGVGRAYTYVDSNYIAPPNTCFIDEYRHGFYFSIYSFDHKVAGKNPSNTKKIAGVAAHSITKVAGVETTIST